MHHKIISQKTHIRAISVAVSVVFSFAPMVTAQAAIEHPLNEFKVIEAPISNQGLTRIAIKEDRILNVFGVTGEYVLEADEDQGQIFIRPNEFNNKPIHLTLTTENGHTQDLRLIPQDKNPESLILKLADKDQKGVEYKPHDLLRRDGIKHDDSFYDKKNSTHHNITHDEVENLIEACRDERIPLGYKLVPIPLQQRDNLKTLPEPPTLIRELRGEKLRCLTYAIQNTSDSPLTLKNEDFAQSQTMAVFIPQKTIAPGERRYVYVITLSH